MTDFASTHYVREVFGYGYIHRKWNYYTTYYEQFLPKKWSGLVCVASNICYAASNEGKYNPESVCLHEYGSRLVCDSLFVCLDIGPSVFT